MELSPTFVGILFTDVVGSTRLWDSDPPAMAALMERHDRLLEEVVTDAGGRIVKGTGDGVLAVFLAAEAAITGAIEAQRHLWSAEPDGLGLPVRMAVHYGAVTERAGDVFGPEVIRCSRLMDAGHGGQVLVSSPARRAAGALDLDYLDLGLHPLRDLSEPTQVYQVLAEGLPADLPPLRTLKAFAHNLPSNLPGFIGRERELDEIKETLEHHRLVTLCGAGGSGKTRLALQVAADCLDRFVDGVWFVDLVGVGGDEDVAAAACAQLGLSESADPIAAIRDAFRRSRTLLLLDNCEHLLESAAALTRQLLGETDALAVLSTSREPLHVPSEAIYPVEPLPVPAEFEVEGGVVESDSVQLLLQRAAEAGVRSAAISTSAAASICRLLDGLPLAIELAASRLRFVPLEELASSLRVSFDTLRTRHSDDPRHATVRSTVAWSYDLLSPDEQLLLSRLSFFRDGWYRQEAISVCSAPPLTEEAVEFGLEALVDRSLVSWRRLESGTTRFRMLEQVRQFGAEKLGDSGARELEQRLIDYYLDRFHSVGLTVMDPEGDLAEYSLAVAAPEILDDVSNLVLAIETALETGRVKDAFDIIASGAWEALTSRSGYFNRYLEWLDQAYVMVDQEDPLLALGALAGAAWSAGSFGDAHWLVDLHERVIRRARELDVEWLEINSMAGMAMGLRRMGRIEESKEMYRRVAERAASSDAALPDEDELFLAGQHELNERAYRRAKRLVERRRSLLPETYDTVWNGMFLAWMAIATGHLEEGLEECDRALDHPIVRAFRAGLCHVLEAKAEILAMLGRQGEAETAANEAMQVGRRIVGPNYATSHAFVGAAIVAEYAAQPLRAESFLREGISHARRLGVDHQAGGICLELIPYALDRGDTAGVTSLVDDADQLITKANRWSDYGPWIERSRARIALAAGQASQAAETLLGVLPEREEDASDLTDVRDGLEVAGSVLAGAGHRRARDVFGALDRWEREHHIVPNPVRLERRKSLLGESELDGSDDAPNLDEALQIAHSALRQLSARQ